ncbi:MAG: hypothetical protein IPL61_36700 [Myxococcales bacterium]|nr:hypothetical protein [Myxococcales bacterium]
MIRLAWFATAAALLVPAVGRAAPPTDDRPAAANWSVLDPALARGYQLPPPGAVMPEPPAHAAAISNILYLNRCVGGCRITKTNFPNSSSLNNSTWIGGDIPVGSQYAFSEFAHGPTVWAEFVQCMKDIYAPYDVQIVETDPSPAPHHEAIVAGTSEEGFRTDALGIAELGAGFCAPKDNAISLNFANSHAAVGGISLAQNLCWTVAQETAHSWGLDHVMECRDSLTYMFGCGPKFFRNVNAPCGTVANRACVCGGNTQNSHGKILAVFGQGTGPQVMPTLQVLQPTEGASFPRGTAIRVAAASTRGLKKILVDVNGWPWVDQPATTNSTHQVTLPDEVPDGVMALRIRACDDIDVCAEQTVTVTRGAPCTTADTCLGGQRCDAGACLWDPPTVDLGGTCEFDQQCLSRLCGDAGTGGLTCTEACQGPPNDLCPDGFACAAGPGEAGLCVPEGAGGEGDGGCCSVDGGGRGAMGGALGLGAVVGLLIARRRRRRVAAAA